MKNAGIVSNLRKIISRVFPSIKFAIESPNNNLLMIQSQVHHLQSHLYQIFLCRVDIRKSTF